MTLSPWFNALTLTLAIDIDKDATHQMKLLLPDVYRRDGLKEITVTALEIIRGIKPNLSQYDWKTGELIDLNPEDLGRVAYQGECITLEGAITETFFAPNCRFFTVQELANVIAEFETLDRQILADINKKGIDDHYIFFEGLVKRPNGNYSVRWGS